MSVETVQEQTIEDNDLAIDLIAKINQDPGNAVTYLIEHSNKYDKSHIHLLLTLIENGRYKDAESSFLALPMDRLEPNRMHKHINDISNKIHDHVEEINRDLEETDPQQKINEDMGR